MEIVFRFIVKVCDEAGVEVKLVLSAVIVIVRASPDNGLFE